ncbi:zinc finger protein [Musa troglodytarum]|uniref:Zinc finger protein n=1 Tax=Musa troglodytarum TaxID=320322 RepID=A0A9E7GRF9_9LILI|nr:zinc finger protein [Musa troglodytarum]
MQHVREVLPVVSSSRRPPREPQEGRGGTHPDRRSQRS